MSEYIKSKLAEFDKKCEYERGEDSTHYTARCRNFLENALTTISTHAREATLTELYQKLLSIEARLSHMGQGADDYFMGIDDVAKIVKDKIDALPPTSGDNQKT